MYLPISVFIDKVNKAVPESPMQTQYLARYLIGMSDYPDLGKNLRIKGDYEKDRTKLDYHDVTIHEDDLPIFIERLKKYYKSI